MTGQEDSRAAGGSSVLEINLCQHTSFFKSNHLHGDIFRFSSLF